MTSCFSIYKGKDQNDQRVRIMIFEIRLFLCLQDVLNVRFTGQVALCGNEKAFYNLLLG